uniref:SDR family oxidoreductase n=1 Tax=Pararhizobium sp. IMCC3301 TaxID=3067904 RepID=UPI002741736E|nr:SDR family oxidoreductase [Pararhizobium sp. IMCC3301]
MGRLAGKRAIITAAANGIGRATALAYAREGAEIIATDLNAAALEGLTEEGISRAVALDVRDSAAVKELAADIGAVDILFNCAGFVHHGSVLECSEDDWDFSFDLNVKSMHRMISAFLPSMLEHGGGSIINMSSGASSLKGAPNRYVYGASKAAVIGLTKAVAIDFIKQGIRCNAICPGTVHSPSWEARVAALGEQLGSYEKALEQFVARQPMGRVAKAEEIAALAVYLGADESGFTTGTTHVIDGGWTL